jgi:2-keto-4-pentenoate hydratase/2-oxohepta-3-ene-1,7-dioic acid hydratase in catechol pathway
MKIVRWKNANGIPMWGRLADDSTAFPMHGDIFAVHSFDHNPVQIGTLLAPVDPPNIIAIGRNYADHAREMKADGPSEEPLIFLKATSSVIGSGEPIVLPNSAPDEVDYEAELAVVIGRRGKNIAESAAMEYVLGYTCANDVSARDCQKRRDKQWARGKSFDTFCPLGPWIVTADELAPDRLAIKSFLNGALMQNGDTGDMIFSVAKLISYVSNQFTLLPGTVILTGTPAGVGSARNPPVFLRSGDEFTVEIDGIGRLTNRVTTDR